MDKEITFELRRQALHIVTGLAALYLIWAELVQWTFFAVILATGIIVSIISLKFKIPIIYKLLDLFERKHAKIPGQGALYLILGILLSMVVFPRDVAMAAIIIVTLGDSISHLGGRLFGKIKHPLNQYKLIEGTFFGFIFAFAGATLFVSMVEAVVAAGIAMFVEGIELKLHRHVFDDNMIIPIVAGVVILTMRVF